MNIYVASYLYLYDSFYAPPAPLSTVSLPPRAGGPLYGLYGSLAVLSLAPRNPPPPQYELPYGSPLSLPLAQALSSPLSTASL